MRDQRRRRSKKKKGKSSAVDSMLTVLIVLIVTVCFAIAGVLIGKGVASVTKKEDNTNKQYAVVEPVQKANTADGQADDNNKEQETEVPIKEFNKEFLNVLVVGVDDGTNGEKGTLNTREADAIMLVNFYYNDGIINVIPIPRDTKISIDDEVINISSSLKHGGIRELIGVTEDKLKSKIHNYIVVDLKVFREIVDIIDGVMMEIPYDMEYDDNMQDLHIRFKKGEYVKLDGEKAAQFVMWRMNNDGWSLPENDMSRMDHLKLFLMKVLDKIKTSKFTQLGMLGEAIGMNVTTDMNVIQITRNVMKLNDVEMSNITYSGFKGEFTRGLEKDSFDFEIENNREILRVLNGSGIKNIGRNEMNMKVVYSKEYEKLEELKEQIKALGYNNVSYESGEVKEEKIILKQDQKENIDFFIYEFGVKKSEIISQNDGKFDIILEVR